MAVTYPPHDPALPIVLVDFDGVLSTSVWPSPTLGEPDPDALALVGHYHDEGCEVHVFTARPDSHFYRIWCWLEEAGIAGLIYDVTGRKIAASLYFDDRAVRWPLND